MAKIVRNTSDLQGRGGGSSPYVGKNATGVSMPIFINGTFQGMQTVDVAFVDNAGKLHAEYMWQSQTVTTQIDEAEAQRILGYASGLAQTFRSSMI